jgi:hypothetical protein
VGEDASFDLKAPITINLDLSNCPTPRRNFF